MAVGDHDTGVLAGGLDTGRTVEHRHAPALARGLDAHDLGVEGEVIEQAEVLGVGAEVTMHLPVGGVVRIGVRHREVGELREGLGRDQVGRLVDARVLGVEVPVAAEIGVALEAVGVEAELEEVLQGGQAVRASPHDGPGSATVDFAHGASILGEPSLGKRGRRQGGNQHILGNSGALL